MKLDNRTIWLTGASHGIGIALAEKLLSMNNRLIITARSSESLERVKSICPERVDLLPCDISEKNAETTLSNELIKLTRELDTIILNAGICEYIDVPDLDIDVIERVTETNYLGLTRCITAALPLLQNSQKKPHIVGLSSASAFISFPRAQAYGASKAAVRYFLQSLRLDCRPLGIDVSIVYPGFVDTRLTRANDFDMPFLLTTEQAVKRIISGIEKRQLEIAFPRRLIWPIRCLSLLPEALYCRIGQNFVRSQETTI